MEPGKTPFEVIRGRSLVWRGLLALIAALIIGAYVRASWLSDPPWEHTFYAIEGVLFNAILMLLVARLLSRANVTPEALVGPDPSWATLRRFTLLPFPLIVFAVASLYLLHVPLSYVAPGFVEALVLDGPPLMLCTPVADAGVLNLMTFFAAVLTGPVVEELVFRGVLLTRWSLKWNLSVGILGSSAAFGLLHIDVVGAFFFGCVMCLVYIETKSLVVPILVHVTYNGICWILAGVDFVFGDPEATLTVAEWQSQWWVGPVAAVVVAPWVIWFLKNRFRLTDWRIPYETSDPNGGSN
ncbi:MAG: type II CAAX endopeptidase family protein [Thermodesulfobacteriota bacterium]